jgi:phosphoglycerate dehydrogenase-like enzyme
MRRVAILNDYQAVALSSADWSRVSAHADIESFSQPFADEDAAAAALAGFEAVCVMRERQPMTRSLLTRLPDLRLIVTTGAANRAIDLDAATELGIIVSGTTNGLGRLATAELTWALILAAFRHLPLEDRSVRAGGWQRTVGRTLRGRTIGIVGLGGVGRYIARYARAFDMEVLAWSRNLTEERAAESMAAAVGFDELLQRSDVVTIHSVLSDETRGLFDAATIARMKRHAVLVNTSRGPIVVEEDLVDALRSGTIAAAALDAYDHEPLPPGHPLLTMDNVVLSPHLGYVTDDVYAEFFTETARSLEAYFAGAPIRLLTDPAPASTSRRYEDVR